MHNCKMNVLFFCGSYYSGGAVKSGIDVARILHECQYVNIKVVLPCKMDAAPLLDKYGVPYIIIPHTITKWNDSEIIPEKTYIHIEDECMNLLEECIDYNDIDIVYTNTDCCITAFKFAKKHNIPCITHLREFDTLNGKKSHVNNEFFDIIKQYNHYIAISNVVKDYYVKNLNVPENKVSVVYNGLPLLDWKKNDIDKLIQDENLNILMSGRIEDYKRQSDAIQAISLLPDDVRKHVNLDIYGQGHYINEIKNLIDELNVSDCVHLMGNAFTMNRHMSKYSIGLMCSANEAFGRVTAEYMACGMCPIASDTGANKEIVTDGQDGIIYQFGNVNELSNHILTLFNHRNRLKELSNNAYLSSHKFEIYRCVDEIYKVFKKFEFTALHVG